MRPARWSVHAAAFRAPHAAAGRQSGTPTRSACARRRANGDDLIGLAPALAAALPGAAFVIGGDLLPVQALRRPPVFLIHGDADEVVPAAAMYAPVAGLQAAEIPVQWSLRRGLPHGIDPDSIAHGAAFLAAAFAETGA
jgi:predicted esterase